MNDETRKNLRYWDQLCETDPAATKPVTVGRKFTAIDPQYQIMRMTEVFGPVGSAWSWGAVHGETNCGNGTIMAWSDVTISIDGHGRWGPFRGAVELCGTRASGKQFYDHDAWKKATTDALTKLMAHIGMSADVFMGRFDDSKYVQDLQQKMLQKQSDSVAKTAERIINEINSAGSLDELEEIAKRHRSEFDSMKNDHKVFARRISGAKQRRTEELNTQEQEEQQ